MSALAAVDGQHECCPRCTAIADYVRALGNEMGLRDHTLDVGHEPPQTPGAVAEVSVAPGRRHARVRVAKDFLALPADDQRHALVHELVHPLLALLVETVEGGVRDELGGQALRIFLAGVRRETERVTDVLAAVIAPAMAPPPWPGDGSPGAR